MAWLFRPRASLHAEILVLRHQLNVLQRKSPKRLVFNNIDRLVFAGLYGLAPNVLDALKILKPETVVRWHRAGFRAYWRWKSRSRGGRPRASAEVRELIREMCLANPLWGAPRIHGELLKLGIDVGQTTVAKYMTRTRRPPSQGWKTFLSNHADGIASMDMFVVPTASFRLLYGLLILQHARYLIRDRDSAYGETFIRRGRSMGIRDRPTSARSPWQNGYAERLIGSVRRDCLDHVVVFGERHLRYLLASYQRYYNEARTHLSLRKDSPVPRQAQAVGRLISVPILGGLHHQYVRA
jgi:transposase InsO family protein